MEEKTIEFDGEKVKVSKENGEYTAEKMDKIDEFIQFCKHNENVHEWSVNSMTQKGAMKFDSHDGETDFMVYDQDVPGEIVRFFSKSVYDYDFYVEFSFE